MIMAVPIPGRMVSQESLGFLLLFGESFVNIIDINMWLFDNMSQVSGDETMKKWFWRILKAVGFLLPFAAGTYGFLGLQQGKILNAMYCAMRLYIIEMDCDPSQVNLWIEFARWTAPLMSVTVILVMVNQLFERMHIRYQMRKKDAVAIHGDSSCIPTLAESLGKRAIVSTLDTALKAPAHVLMFREDHQLLSYLNKHRKTLLENEKKVYLCSESLVRGNFQNRNLVLCNFSENCAGQYWKTYPLSVAQPFQQVVLIGMGNYGSAILSQALLTNVLSVDSRIVYHVFGDSSRFRGLHTQLHQFLDLDTENPTRDCICFHDTPWWECAEILTQADRIILANDDEETNLMQLSEVRKYYPAGKIHVKVSDPLLLDDLWSDSVAFGTVDSLCTAEQVLKEGRLRDAKRIHGTYFGNYQCNLRNSCTKAECCDNCRQTDEDWSKLDTFKRYSNVAQADHIPVKIQILLGDGFRSVENAGAEAKRRFEQMSPEEKEKLFEIEHIRWCRYHYMNNWQYAPVRNNARRQHPLLIPYQELRQQEENKDVDTWYTAFTLYQNSY